MNGISGSTKETYIYPVLGAVKDLGFVRLSGVGLGNSFFSYFHAFVLAKQSAGHLIRPAWPSLKLGTWLRQERSKRTYIELFRPLPDEVSGLKKARLFVCTRNRNEIEVYKNCITKVKTGTINNVKVKEFTFNGLREHRNDIRFRVLTLLRTRGRSEWKQMRYIGVHVRLGDFATAKDKSQALKNTNTRIPLEWYINVVAALRARYPEYEIRLFSDGHPSELKPLLSTGVTLHCGESDAEDLIALASSSLVVASLSTFSEWAVFLGNQPSIWLQTERIIEQPSDRDVPWVTVPLDSTENMLLPAMRRQA